MKIIVFYIFLCYIVCGMIKLIIENNYTYILNNSGRKDIDYKINKLLEFRPKNYFFSPLYKKKIWDGYIRIYDVKNSRFPTGLLKRVLNFFKKQQIKFEIQDVRKKTGKKITLIPKKKLPPLRDYQKQAVEIFLKKERGILNLATGTGKTMIATKIIEELKVQTLFVCPNTVIMHQTAKIFKDFFGENKVGLYYGKQKQIARPIVVSCVSSLKNASEKEFSDFGLLILDEFHHISASQYLELNKEKWKNIYYKLGLTATMMRADGAEMQMEGVLDEIIFKMDAKEAIKQGFLTEPHFFLNRIKHTYQKIRQWHKIYKVHIVQNETRNDLIAEKAISCQNKNLSILILVKEVDHGKILSEKIPNSVFIHGNTDEREELIQKFREGKIKTVIGTSIFGEGSDIPIIDVLINAQACKAEGDLIQKIGRVLRLYENKKKSLIIDFLDEGEFILEKQAKQRLKVYQEHFGKNINISKKIY